MSVNKPLAVRPSPHTDCRKSPESLRKGGGGWRPSQAPRFPSSHPTFPCFVTHRPLNCMSLPAYRLLVLSNATVPLRALQRPRASAVAMPRSQRILSCCQDPLSTLQNLSPLPALLLHLGSLSGTCCGRESHSEAALQS